MGSIPGAGLKAAYRWPEFALLSLSTMAWYAGWDTTPSAGIPPSNVGSSQARSGAQSYESAILL